MELVHTQNSVSARIVTVVICARQERIHQHTRDLLSMCVLGSLGEPRPRLGDRAAPELVEVQCLTANHVDHRSLALLAQQREELLGDAEHVRVVATAEPAVR
ncbi:Uncharacterised protein [Mycobacteroides abscessus subsp. massiliense]|nr:Uncharacterised protein [Mycobacteroides abscessus subsp. massiliense]